jgi:hypothetical protein
MNVPLTRGAGARIGWLGLVAIALAFGAGGAFATEDTPASPFTLALLSLQSDETAPVAADHDAHSVARGTWLRLRGFGIWSQASGNIDFHRDGPIIDVLNDIDFEDTLGMDLDEFTGGALIGFNFGDDKQFHLDFSYWGFYDWDGDRDVGTIIFDDEIFTGQVESRARVHEGDVDLGWDLWRPESVPLTLTGTLGLRVYYVDAEVRESPSGRDASITFVAPIPTLGLGLRWDVTRNVYVRGAVSGIYAGELGNYIDASAEVGVDLTRNLGLFVGYRFWDFHVEWDDDNYDFDNSLLYGGVEVRL